MRLLLTLLACLGLLVAIGGCVRAGGEPFQPTLTQPLTLEQGRTIGQTFNPAGRAVTAVDVHVATFAAAADPEGILTVRLHDAESGAVLDTAQVAGEDLADATWVSASFDTPVDVGEVALLEVSWAGASPLALWANVPPDGPPTRVVNDPYAGGQLVVDGRAIDGDLAFRIHGTGGVPAGVAQTVEVLRSAGARLAAQPVFAALWLLALIGCGILAVSGLRRRA
ncbi:MAG TPA: DUF6212 domain-containing protein [Euzebya sp.]|nr:DUF6212 domain-containing protein [Euzebya sp.]